MTLGAQDLLSYFSGQYPQPAPLTQPISDENCLKCHSDIPEQRNFKKHYHYFLDDWQRLSDNAGSCTECHQSHATDGNVQIAFLNASHTSQVCQRCHNFNEGG